MSACIDSSLGKLLHAYETDGLSDHQREDFELHLLQCDHCMEEISEFDHVASLLRDDSAVHQAIARAVSESSRAQSGLVRLLNHLWPDTNLLLKPAIGYVVVALLLYPAYLGLKDTDTGGIKELQTLTLSGTRSSLTEIPSASEDLLIRFRFYGSEAGKIYRVTIVSERAEVVFRDDRFAGFDSTENAFLLIPAGTLSTGQYTVNIEDLQGEPPFNVQEYPFRIE